MKNSLKSTNLLEVLFKQQLFQKML
ncbi:hypothetical protein XFF6991_580003 [Xanthomonas phaseoli pv. phaseoli]|uniref:Uncharacterized protein n=1 Tax=Xanthomonas campestris pv. phaseoli TaxID=317013 RepID=A0A7Z7J649_XANCH|nr:hypothetical protein XFF6991_580003 [Xanthomonas phaseoli pv. phaseoli]